MKIRNMVTSFVIFYVIIILVVTAFSGIKDGYNIEEQELNSEGKNVFESLSELNLINGINDLTLGIQKLTNINAQFDILGGLASVGSGVLQTIGGIVTFPIEIIDAISQPYYDNIIPPIIAKLLGFIVTISVGFILLSAKLGFEL